MKTNFDIWKWLAPVVLLLAQACGHDYLIDSEDTNEAAPYVELRIAIPVANPGSTRANPMGGEEGNGRERGILNEDKIHDINIFFYREDAGMNGAPETPIDYHFFYNLQNPDDNLNSKVDSIKEDNTHYGERFIQLKFLYWKDGDVSQSKGLKFLAIANVGKLQSESFATLGALRDIDFTKVGNTWTTTYDNYSRDASKMDFFLMSTAYNDAYQFGGRSTGTNTIEYINENYIGTTTLQRMYARLDLWYAKENEVLSDNKVSQLKYIADNTQNTVFLTNVLPVNVMQKPSFLFKKVTNGISSFTCNDLIYGLTTKQYLWGGKESPSDGPGVGSGYVDLPQNYVIERHTEEKTPDGSASDVLESWYKNTKVASVKTDITSSANGKMKDYWHGVPNSASSNDYASERISVIGYANENTHPVDCYRSDYLTGMAFRAVYVPAALYGGYDAVSKSPIALTEAERAAFNTEGATIYRYSPSAETLDESKSLYFTDSEALKAYQRDHGVDSALVAEFTADRETVGSNLGLVCYYNLWLRHYNNEAADPNENYPMEYATVRNNIYRVKVAFTGPGDPTPTMREPDTMQARIFVRKWNYREEDTFYFD